MRMICAVVVALLLPMAAQAQDGPHVNLLGDGPGKSPDDIEREQAQQKAYRDSLRKIPDAKASSDPWGGVRTTEAPSTAKQAKAAPAKPKSKSSTSTPN